MSQDKQEFFITDKTKLNVGDIQAAARQAWVDVRTEGTIAHARAQKNGIDAATLPEKLEEELKIESSAAGIGSVDLLLVAVGPLAWDLWKYVLLPHIREKWGDNAIKAKNAAAKAAAKKAK